MTITVGGQADTAGRGDTAGRATDAGEITLSSTPSLPLPSCPLLIPWAQWQDKVDSCLGKQTVGF